MPSASQITATLTLIFSLISPLLLFTGSLLPFVAQAQELDQEKTTSLEAILEYQEGLQQLEEGQLLEALATFQQILVTHRERGDRLAEGIILGNIGEVYHLLEQYDQSLAFYQQALRIFEELGNRQGQAIISNNIGVFYKTQGQYEQALKFYQQALALCRKLDISEREVCEAINLNNIGEIYRNQGQYTQALNCYQKALAIFQSLGKLFGEAATLHNLGGVYGDLGQYERALASYQLALDLRNAIGDRKGTAATLNNIGLVYEAQKQDEQALAFYRQALEVRREVGAAEGTRSDRVGAAITLNNLGLVENKLERHDQALKSLEQALAIFQEVGDRVRVGNTFDSLGTVYKSMGRYAQALESYQQALGILKDAGSRPIERITLSNIGELLKEQNQPELAIIFYKQSVNITETLREGLQELSQDLQQSYTDFVAVTYRSLADLLLEQDRIIEAQRVLDLLKVQEINDYTRGQQDNENTRQGIPLTNQEQQDWTSYETLINQAVSLGKELDQLKKSQNLTQDQIKRINEIQQAQIQLNENFNNFINTPEIRAAIKNTNIGTQDADFIDELSKLNRLPNKLKKINAVLLYPLILDNKIELIITTPYSPPTRHTVQVNKKDLNETILKFRQALQDPTSDPQPIAKKLYQWLIQPLEEDLKTANVKTIIYAPDGQLRYIPLVALYDGKQWLIERYQVNHITAMSLTDFDDEPEGDLQILAGAFSQGNYNFNIGRENFTFGGLPYAGKEVAILGDMIPNTVQLLNNDFSKVNTTTRMIQSNVVHLATHAAIVVGQPEDSFILFGNGERVTLKEVENWQFDHIDLIVFSACETGLGGNLGDGKEILGFGYLMKAKASIASLWSVSDGGTQALMTAFYTALQIAKTTKAEALQKAQIALITGNYEALGEQRGIFVRERINKDVPSSVSSHLNHPYYWAPFILIGNGL